METVFISYRREESAGHAGRIYDRLREKFGKERVFMDVSAIEPGVDFVESIDRAVGSCMALLVVVGRRWLECADATGRRRLDDPRDFIRLEVSTALRRNIRVIPVLVQGATMPEEEALPDDLRLLARRNAIGINDTHWDSDLAQLVETLERVLVGGAGPATVTEEGKLPTGTVAKTSLPKEAAKTQGTKRLIVYSSIAVAVILVILIVALRPGRQLPSGASPPPAPVHEAPKAVAIAPETIPAGTPTTPPVEKVKPDTISRTPGTVFRDILKGGTQGPQMVVIPAGSYTMGDTWRDGYKNEQPVHVVRIQRPFAMGKYEVTFQEYDTFTRATGRELLLDQGWGRGRRPVINFSWEEAVAYADWLSKQTGKRYRLPWEAEWEYAARSGGKEEKWAGTSVEGELGDYAWYDKNSAGKTHPVGEKKPNGLGLHDMSGNVSEWLASCWKVYLGAPDDGSTWMSGDCRLRGVRGGSWLNKPWIGRSVGRVWNQPRMRTSDIGFRLARDL